VWASVQVGAPKETRRQAVEFDSMTGLDRQRSCGRFERVKEMGDVAGNAGNLILLLWMKGRDQRKRNYEAEGTERRTESRFQRLPTHQALQKSFERNRRRSQDNEEQGLGGREGGTLPLMEARTGGFQAAPRWALSGSAFHSLQTIRST
jgi:hypothetical protein